MTWSILKDLSADTTGNNTGWSGYTMRHLFSHSADINGYPGLGSGGTKIRISLRGGQTSGLVVDKVYVGLRAASGDVYDFASTPTQITWSGGGSVSVGALANSPTSDEIPFAFDGTTDIVIAVHFSGTTNLLDIVGSETGGLACYYVAGDSAATVNASASQALTTAYAIGKVEVFAPDAGVTLTKYTGYAVEGAALNAVTAAKLAGYVVEGGAIDRVSASKLTAYAVGVVALNAGVVSKLVGYAVTTAPPPTGDPVQRYTVNT